MKQKDEDMDKLVNEAVDAAMDSGDPKRWVNDFEFNVDRMLKKEEPAKRKKSIWEKILGI